MPVFSSYLRQYFLNFWNKFNLKVKAEDGTERVYTINVHREEENIVVEDEEVDEDVTTGATTDEEEVVDKKTSIIIVNFVAKL